jgi:hypothetical protein
MKIKTRVLCIALAAWAAIPLCSGTDVPAPKEILGFEPGQDFKLADWTQILDYFGTG